MRHLLIVILIGLLVVMPSCKYFKGGSLFGKKARTMAIMKAQEDSIRYVDSLLKVKESLEQIEKQMLDSARAEESRKILDEIKKFNIIVGSFITPAYADAMAEDYRRRGYDPRIIKPEGSKFKYVAAEGHDNFGRAVNRLRQFQDTVQIESWLYVRRK
jgi:hypothetical protein